MIFTETKLEGAFVVEPERFEDEREFAARGLETDLAECDISFNKRKGTLRGMHYQETPHSQAKLVRCTMGALFDVIVDLKPSSPTFKQWVGVELTSVNRLMLYVPKEFAHGFQTLEDDSEIFYQMSSEYLPGSGRGVRWDDPAFGVEWPEGERVIIARDRGYPDFTR